MKNRLGRISTIAFAAFLTASSAVAQKHKWAGRSLDNIEWAVHEKLAVLPFYGVFDTVRFEIDGNTVTLSGSVVRESVKLNAERAVRQVAGLQKVVNNIELLPSSPRDEALRKNLYRAIYGEQTQNQGGAREIPPVHIIVKNGWASLEGVVNSDSDRNMIRTRALSITAHLSDNVRVAN